MKTAIVTAQALSGSGTQDFTSSGFGTPQACLIFFNYGLTEDADTGHNLYGVGAFDGTNVVCAYTGDEDGSTETSDRTASGIFDTHPMYFGTYLAGAFASRSASAAWMTDGVQLTWSAGTVLPIVHVVLIKDVVGAVAGNYAPSSTQDASVDVTTTGITPNALIHFGNTNTTKNTNAGISALTLGYATSRGGIVQAAMRHGANASINTISSSQVYDGYCGSSGSSIQASGYEATAFAANQFTITTRLIGAALRTGYQGFLAIQDSVAPDVFIATTPTSGSFDPYAGNFQPNFVLMQPNRCPGVNINYGSGDVQACAHRGFYLLNSSTETGSSVVDKRGVATSFAKSRRSAAMIVQGQDAGAPVFVASGPTFDSSGLVYTPSTYSATALKIPGIAFAPSASGRVSPLESKLLKGKL